MEVQGRLIKKFESKTFGDSGFKVRQFVVETDDQYPQKIIMQFIKDKCELLNGLEFGQIVKVSINLQGREWTSPQGEVKYFNTIQAWKIESLQGHALNSTGSAVTDYQNDKQTQGEQEDDLPF